MSRLPVVSSKEFTKFLIQKGFIYSRTRGCHHVYKLNDRLVTVPERKEIGKGLLLDMIEEAGLSREDFIRWWNS